MIQIKLRPEREWYTVRGFDRALDKHRAPSLLVGGKGIRYMFRVKNRTLYLFRDGDRWYAEPV
jgi:hypothetical protein